MRETIEQFKYCSNTASEWAFRCLYEYVAYKAREQGVETVQVNPRNTSKRCSTCGFTHDDNRDGEDFACLDCGYQNHADDNAAKNIGLQYLRRPQKSESLGLHERRSREQIARH